MRNEKDCGCIEDTQKECIQCGSKANIQKDGIHYNGVKCTEKDPCNQKYSCECEVRIGTDCVNYSGPDMEDTGIKRGDILTDVLIKQMSKVENVKAYLENKLNLRNVGKGLTIYRGENNLSFKEFRSIEGSGSITLKYSTDNGSIEINAPKPIKYGVKTSTENYTLIQKVEKPELTVNTYLKGLNKTASIDIIDNGIDLSIGVNEEYLTNIIKTLIDPAIEEVTRELERILKEITEKIETFERLVDKKIEDATNELNTIIENILKELEALGIGELTRRIEAIEEKTTFIVPGLVLIWNKPLSEIPEGFRECTSLRGRIPVGMLTTDVNYNTLGKEGGEKTLTLSIDQMPKHTHSGETKPGGAHTHSTFTNRKVNGNLEISGPEDVAYMSSDGSDWRHKQYAIRRASSGSIPNTGKTSSAVEHNHELSIGETGGNTPITILNPYRIVNYIEYIG